MYLSYKEKKNKKNETRHADCVQGKIVQINKYIIFLNMFFKVLISSCFSQNSKKKAEMTFKI